MKLKYKKIVAREILIIVSLTLIGTILYICLSLLNNHAEEVTQDLKFKLTGVEKLIEEKSEQILTLRPPLILPKGFNALNSSERYHKNNKPKFNPNKPYTVIENDSLLLDPTIRESIKKDSVQRVALKKEILNLKKHKQILNSELPIKYDRASIIKTALILLLAIFYPIRIIFFGTVWSIKVLKTKIEKE